MACSFVFACLHQVYLGEEREMREEGRLISQSIKVANAEEARRRTATREAIFLLCDSFSRDFLGHPTRLSILCCHWMRDLVGEVVLSESNSLAFVSPMMLASTTQQVMEKARCKGNPIVE